MESYLQQQFSQEFKIEVKKDVQVLVKWIKENIILNDTANLHSRSPLSPGVSMNSKWPTAAREMSFS
jgi:hypothetical protein